MHEVQASKEDLFGAVCRLQIYREIVYRDCKREVKYYHVGRQEIK